MVTMMVITDHEALKAPFKFNYGLPRVTLLV